MAREMQSDQLVDDDAHRMLMTLLRKQRSLGSEQTIVAHGVRVKRRKLIPKWFWSTGSSSTGS